MYNSAYFDSDPAGEKIDHGRSRSQYIYLKSSGQMKNVDFLFFFRLCDYDYEALIVAHC